jgi:putative phosphoribosyl transferase
MDDSIEQVQVDVGDVVLDGDLGLPESARGVVLFAHGSGSSRHSPRNRQVAESLRARGLATLLLDLLTGEEEAVDATTGHLRFDIGMLARRLGGAAGWLGAHQGTSDLPIGCFGASTGGGAALVAAADRPGLVRSVVSRGGRPDLAGEALRRVEAPALLIVGSRDEPVLTWNREAAEQMPGRAEVEVVPGATHLFEEPGALEEVSRLAGEWFEGTLERR